MNPRHAIPFISAICVLALAACASPREQRERQQQRAATTFLERQGSIAEPGRVAAADFAFARMARDEGQWTAFANTAADGAILHGRAGAIQAGPWLAQQTNPEQSVAWAPNTVWSSCDGTLAVTFGRFQDAQGLVGSYVTVWELQRDNRYEWIYDMGAPDNPQPTPPTREDLPEDAIVVEGLTSIEGRVADCPRRGEPPVALPAANTPTLGGNIRTRSADGTLQWTWAHSAEERRVIVEWVRDGEAQQALEFTAPLPPESAD